MKIDILQNLELSGLILQLIQSLRLVALVLDKLLLLSRLSFDVVLQPLNDLLLRGNLVLRPL